MQLELITLLHLQLESWTLSSPVGFAASESWLDQSPRALAFMMVLFDFAPIAFLDRRQKADECIANIGRFPWPITGHENKSTIMIRGFTLLTNDKVWDLYRNYFQVTLRSNLKTTSNTIGQSGFYLGKTGFSFYAWRNYYGLQIK